MDFLKYWTSFRSCFTSVDSFLISFSFRSISSWEHRANSIVIAVAFWGFPFKSNVNLVALFLVRLHLTQRLYVLGSQCHNCHLFVAPEGSLTSLHLHRNLEYWIHSSDLLTERVLNICWVSSSVTYINCLGFLWNLSQLYHRTLEVAVLNQRNLVVPVVTWVGRCS